MPWQISSSPARRAAGQPALPVQPDAVDAGEPALDVLHPLSVRLADRRRSRSSRTSAPSDRSPRHDAARTPDGGQRVDALGEVVEPVAAVAVGDELVDDLALLEGDHARPGPARHRRLRTTPATVEPTGAAAARSRPASRRRRGSRPGAGSRPRSRSSGTGRRAGVQLAAAVGGGLGGVDLAAVVVEQGHEAAADRLTVAADHPEPHGLRAAGTAARGRTTGNARPADGRTTTTSSIVDGARRRAGGAGLASRARAPAPGRRPRGRRRGAGRLDRTGRTIGIPMSGVRSGSLSGRETGLPPGPRAAASAGSGSATTSAACRTRGDLHGRRVRDDVRGFRRIDDVRDHRCGPSVASVAVSTRCGPSASTGARSRLDRYAGARGPRSDRPRTGRPAVRPGEQAAGPPEPADRRPRPAARPRPGPPASAPSPTPRRARSPSSGRRAATGRRRPRPRRAASPQAARWDAGPRPRRHSTRPPGPGRRPGRPERRPSPGGPSG